MCRIRKIDYVCLGNRQRGREVKNEKFRPLSSGFLKPPSGGLGVVCGVSVSRYGVDIVPVYLLLKNKINSQHKKDKPDQVVPPDRLAFEKDQGKSCKYKKSYYFLYDF